MKRKALVVAAIAFSLFGVLPAQAHITRQTTYRYDQIWSTAVRFLRVDKGYKVTEQDKTTGYLLFEYDHSGRKLMASMELFETVESGLQYVTMGVRIQDMPRYIETVLLDGLERKLRDEYGRPPTPMPVTPPEAEKTVKKKKGDEKPDDDDNGNDDEAKDDVQKEDEEEPDE